MKAEKFPNSGEPRRMVQCQPHHPAPRGWTSSWSWVSSRQRCLLVSITGLAAEIELMLDDQLVINIAVFFNSPSLQFTSAVWYKSVSYGLLSLPISKIIFDLDHIIYFMDSFIPLHFTPQHIMALFVTAKD